MAGVRATKSGLSRDTQLKINAKYDQVSAVECLKWIRDTVNSTLEPAGDMLDFDIDGSPENFFAVLSDGVILARMTNAIQPGSIPASKYSRPPKLPFKKMELIELFINKTKEYGVPDYECFQTVDLYEKQNLNQVVICIQSLGRKAKACGLKGFGPKESAANPREFSDEQLKAGKNVIGLQMGTNKGASQAGMTFGKHRMILD